ncbi:MAG: ion transporter [Pirellulales bacterium]|nr:ion transporter [Pirellulales bacterium]
MSLKTIIENADTPAGKAFDIFIQVLILISLVSFCVETLPDITNETRYWLYVVEVVTVALFTIEYGLRILVSENRLRFIFSFYGMIDLVAILPFYISTGVDLRTVRVLRLFRVFRIFKIVRYTQAINRFRAAFVEIREEMVLFFIATAMVLFISSVGIYYFEGEVQPDDFGSVFHCMWWAIITLTTVGYGDALPITLGGRIFTGFILMLGLGIVAVPTGLLASALTKTKSD